MSHAVRLFFPWILLATTLAGCAAPESTAVFVTRTSLGVDVDAAPTTVSFGYNRAEGYLGPRYDSGTIPGVAGAFHTDGGLFNRKIRQTYATGKAALNATSAVGKPAEAEEEYFSGDRKGMFFGTSTIIGVNMGFGDTAAASSFTLGFKRKELSVIPVSGSVTSTITAGTETKTVTHIFPSVFARFDNTTEAKTANDSTLDIHQFFATGLAAQRLANDADVKREFIAEAKGDVKARYRDEEHKQSRLAHGAVLCVTKIADGELPKVWSNAEALGIFKDKEAVADMRKAASAQAARGEYVYYMGLLQPTNLQQTVVLDLHTRFVCELPGAKA